MKPRCRSHPWLTLLATTLVVALLAIGALAVNTWWLAMEGAADICLMREPNERGGGAAREGLFAFRCVYVDGFREREGSKVWIWNRS